MAIDFEGGRIVEVIDQRAFGGELAKVAERFRFQFDGRPWSEGHRGSNRFQSIVEFVPPGQTAQNWSELVTTQRTHDLVSKGVSAKQFVNAMKKNLDDSGVENEWRILRDGENDVLYEWSTPGGKAHEAQHEIARVVAGVRDLHRIAYTAKVQNLPPKDRQKWVKIISRATLVAQK